MGHGHVTPNPDGTRPREEMLAADIIDAQGVTIGRLYRELEQTRRERDEWKRRAAAHGCNTEQGDPDCG